MNKMVYYFGEGQAEGDPKRRDLLGGKGAGLAEMTSLGLPVPAGITLSTELCNTLLAANKSVRDDEQVKRQVLEALARVEKAQGGKLGDPSNPLLVSVRSGARASMPGMMDTILNLGLNDTVAEGLVKKSNARFVFDAYRRFIAMYSDVAMGVKRELFEHPLEEARVALARTRGVDPSKMNVEELKRKVPDSELSAEALQQIVKAYKGIFKQATGKEFPSDPHEQLWGAVDAVFHSWKNHRATVYRKMHDIPESWGTACNIQSMVFGNLGDTSATGVAFSRDPSTGERKLYGEWLPNAQGEDVVAGIRTPLVLSARNEAADKGTSLESRMPPVYKEFVAVAEKLEKHFRDAQDIEFTVQDGKLYILQCRSAKRTGPAAVRMAVEMAKEGLITREEALLRVDPASIDQLLHPTLDPSSPKKLLGKGLPASPGAAQGEIVLNANEAEKLAADGKKVILVRVETSPEDIHGMKAARGIVTARGGMTSHAAVVARGMGKPCIAGCSAMQVDYAAQTVTVTVYGPEGKATDTVVLKKGDVITIDGGSGSLYQGSVPTVSPKLGGEFGELMVWADAARTLKIRTNADTPEDAQTARQFGAEGIGLCRTEHMFFNDERIAAVREMILSDDEPSRRRALMKLLPAQREDFVGIFKAMDGLPVTIRLLDPPLHEFLPNDDKQIDHLSKVMNVSAEKLRQRTRDLHEFNPMLGHRGCRLAVTYPEIYEMQVRAILEAALEVSKQGIKVLPEIMIPLAISKAELVLTRAIVDEVKKDVFGKAGREVPFMYGTMIELPRAAVMAGQITEVTEFFSFGTNDLTQATMGLSRDDAGKFLPAYIDKGLLPKDPFVSIDQEGVGALVKMAVDLGRAAKPTLKLGVCGEHGGDPASIGFFHKVGLNYVSCSPFRVPIARLAAAQAALRANKAQA
jgi:pyruvate,orthophosphate dikinase